jgi:hypothetical protein
MPLSKAEDAYAMFHAREGDQDHPGPEGLT